PCAVLRLTWPHVSALFPYTTLFRSLKGPVRPIVLREKRRVAGMWVNANSIRLRTSPGFYAIGSSRPIEQLVDERTAAIFELGLRSEEHTSELQSRENLV